MKSLWRSLACTAGIALLAACGGGKEPAKSTDTSTATESTAPEEAELPLPSPEAQAAIDQDAANPQKAIDFGLHATPDLAPDDLDEAEEGAGVSSTPPGVRIVSPAPDSSPR